MALSAYWGRSLRHGLQEQADEGQLGGDIERE
jgi:hypothetical protein